MTLGIERFDRLELVLWQQVALGFVDTDLGGNGVGGVRVVAGEHQGFDAQLMQLADRFAAGLLDRVCHGEKRQRACVVAQQDHGFALFLQRKQFFFQRR